MDGMVMWMPEASNSSKHCTERLRNIVNGSM